GARARPVQARRDEQLAVRGEGESREEGLAGGEAAQFLAGGGIPDVEGGLGEAGAGRQQLAVGGEGHSGGAVLSRVVRAAQQAAERPLDRGAHPLPQSLAGGGVPDEDG